MAKPPKREELSLPRLIVCEGASDEAFFRALIKQRGLPRFCVRHTGDTDSAGKGGKSKYATFLKGLPLWRGFYDLQTIIIVGDNDDNPAAEFAAIQDQIKDAKPTAIPPVQYGVPRKVMEFQSGQPAKIAILMIPDSTSTGGLETLCFAAAAHPGASTVNNCVSQFVSCVGVSDWSPAKIAKLQLRVHMAARHKKNPALALMHAWSNAETKKLIPLSATCFDPIETFLKTA